jgi:putative DNA-invertase from lambdoid prophage Rac
MSVYGYARVSTQRSANEGMSLPAQERVISGYALMKNLTVARTFIEGGISGAKPLADRPEGKLLMALLVPGDVVITAKLDRMFRSALDALAMLAWLQKRGVALHMIDLGGDVINDPISKLVFTILAAVAEAERDRIRERITAVKSYQRTLGRYLGGNVPYGYERAAESLVPVPHQQDVISAARRWRASGGSLRAIQTKIRLEHGARLSLSTLHAWFSA